MNLELPILKAKEVINILEKAGFFIHHQSGSHVQMKHPSKLEKRITIPKHNKDLPKPIIKSIIRQTGLSIEEFKKLI